MEFVPWILAGIIYVVLFISFWPYREPHEHAIMCVHGDRINLLGGARGICIICDKKFDQLPDICFYTGQPHRLEQDA